MEWVGIYCTSKAVREGRTFWSDRISNSNCTCTNEQRLPGPVLPALHRVLQNPVEYPTDAHNAHDAYQSLPQVHWDHAIVAGALSACKRVDRVSFSCRPNSHVRVTLISMPSPSILPCPSSMRDDSLRFTVGIANLVLLRTNPSLTVHAGNRANE